MTVIVDVSHHSIHNCFYIFHIATNHLWNPLLMSHGYHAGHFGNFPLARTCCSSLRVISVYIPSSRLSFLKLGNQWTILNERKEEKLHVCTPRQWKVVWTRRRRKKNWLRSAHWSSANHAGTYFHFRFWKNAPVDRCAYEFRQRRAKKKLSGRKKNRVTNNRWRVHTHDPWLRAIEKSVAEKLLAWTGLHDRRWLKGVT